MLAVMISDGIVEIDDIEGEGGRCSLIGTMGGVGLRSSRTLVAADADNRRRFEREDLCVVVLNRGPHGSYAKSTYIVVVVVSSDENLRFGERRTWRMYVCMRVRAWESSDC
jgi:hypothetical protein